MSELTAAHSTIEKAREVTNCPQGVDLQDHLKMLVAELITIEAIHNNAVLITDEHYEQCPSEVQKVIGALAVLNIPATDSILREAEARGVDAFTAKLRRDLEELDPEIFAYGEVKNALDMAITSSEMFSRQLSEGKAE